MASTPLNTYSIYVGGSHLRFVVLVVTIFDHAISVRSRNGFRIRSRHFQVIIVSNSYCFYLSSISPVNTNTEKDLRVLRNLQTSCNFFPLEPFLHYEQKQAHIRTQNSY